MISIKEYFGSHSGDPPLASSLHGINKECIPNNEKCNRRSNISQMSEENTVNNSPKNNHVDLTHQNDDKLNEKIRSNMKAVIKKHNKYKKRCKSKKNHSSTADLDILDISNVLTNSLTIISGTSPKNIETAELTPVSVDDHKTQVIQHKRNSKRNQSRACLSINKELNKTYLVVDAINADLNIVSSTCISKAVDHSVKLSTDVSIDTVQFTENVVTYQKNENTEHVQDKSKLSPNKQIFTRRNSDSVNMTKINAFQVMMQARNKIIGSNSPGKGIQDDLSLEDKLAKENLVKRKLMLEGWSEKLGGQKRKVNEILQEEHIKNVMDKRAKRLKKMLTRNKYEKDEKLITSDSNQRKYTKQKQAVNNKDHSAAIKKKRHASDSSIDISDIDSLRSCTTASQDTEQKLNKTIQQKKLGSQSDGIMIKNKKKDPIMESDKTDLKNKSVHISAKEAGNIKIKKCAHEMSESKIKNNEHSTFLSKLSPPSKKRDSLLSYFEQINSKSPIPDVILDQDENDDTLNKIIKVKFTPKRTQKSFQKARSLVNNKDKEVNTSKDVSQVDIDNTTHRNTNLKPTKSKSTTPRSSWKMRVKIVSNTEGCLVEEENVDSEVIEILDDSADLGVLPTTPKTVQTHKKSLRLIRKHELEQEKRAAAPSVSPIRIDDIRSPKIIHCTKSSNIANKDLDLVGTSSPKSTRNKKFKRSSSEFSSFSKLAPLFIKNIKPLIDKEALKAKETFLKSGVPDVIKKMMEVQKAVEEFELDIFPKISHIQQNCGETYKCSKKLENFNVWNLPVEMLNFLSYKTDDIFSYFPTNEVMRLGMFTSCIGLRCQNLEKAAIDNNLTTSLQKQISNYKNLLQIIKQCHPYFPVYKVFRQLKQKNCIQNDTKPNYTLNFENEILFKQINYDEIKTSKCKSLKKNELHKPRLLKKKKISIPVPIIKKSNAFLSEDSSESIEFIFGTEQTCVSNIRNKLSNDYLDEVVNENKIEHMSSSCTVDNILWTDKYRPLNSEEIIGNSIAAKTLKAWLTRCKELDNLQKHKMTTDADCSDSSDDFTDDSNDSSRLKTMVGNTTILIGPVGSGKTSTVYALAGELGFNVLEINASSKRTGKKVLADLQEATQSHHIRGKSDGRIPEMKVKSKKFKTKIRTYSRIQNVSQCTSDAQSIQTEACLKNNRNLSLILVEDINIVFEQDDGFLAALSQIVQTSKRPVIITSSVENHSNLQKLMDNMVIRFHPANPNHISIYMQILCLVENVMVEESQVYELLLLNKGDFRKTLMQLHFWTASGADLKSYKAKSTRQQSCDIADKGINYEHISEVQTSYTSQSASLLRGLRTDSMDSCKLASDDNSSISWLEETEMKHKTTSKCVEDVVNDKTYINKSLVSTFITTKNYAYLEKLWFIMPNMLLVKCNSTNTDTKLETIDTTTEDKANQCTSLPIKTTQSPIGDLQKLSSFYENIVFIDTLHSKMDQWQTGSEMSYSSEECCLEVTEYVAEQIKNCADIQMNEDEISRSHWNDRRLYISEVNQALKHFSEGTSIQLIQHLTSPCDSPLSVTAYNPSLTLDYMPYLRNISRAEKNRYETNIKRSNRFYHYLRTLNVNCSNEILDFACNSFLK